MKILDNIFEAFNIVSEKIWDAGKGEAQQEVLVKNKSWGNWIHKESWRHN